MKYAMQAKYNKNNNNNSVNLFDVYTICLHFEEH